ncbi:LuxR C-terminal-related transcriptional regulator [Streptomyces sp. NPDC047928]|uniref:helix-turn-helix transcriptional regulator n=1 Tax=unclassified Streptomyces TaxID=2593676 RepID=UPI00371D5500
MADVRNRTAAQARLHGRSAALRAVRGVFEGLRHGHGGALLVAAEPGLGRTALLERAAHEFRTAGPTGATEATVLMVTAAPAESDIPCSGLHALLSAARRTAGTAVTGAGPGLAGSVGGRGFGSGPGGGGGTSDGGGGGTGGGGRAGGDVLLGTPGPGRLLELLESLGDVAGGGPLLVCVDDAHLWDAGSRAALGFAARRPGALHGVALILSVAEHRLDEPDFAGLPVVRLAPLAEDAAAALLEDLAGVRVDPGVRDELLHEAEGNPAVLRALVRGLSREELAGHAPLRRPLTDGAALGRVFARRLGELPQDTRQLLLLVAAAHERDPVGPGADAAVVLRAALRAGLGAGVLDAAEAAGIARGSGDRIAFTGSLPWRAVLAGAPLSRRRAAHRLLASVLAADPYRLPHLLHRALAADGPDPALAADLAGAAAVAQPGATHGERSAAWARAAELTADDGARTARLAAAAEHARLAGRPWAARRLLAVTREGAVHDAVRGRTALVRGTLALRDGPAGDAHETLLLAAGLLRRHDPVRAAEARFGAMEAAWAAGDTAGCLRALSADGPAGSVDEDFRAGMSAVLEGRTGSAWAPLRRVIAGAGGQDDPARLLRAGVAALVVGDLPAACAVNARALAVARASGLIAYVPQILEHLAYAELRAGRHARARAHAQEGLRAAHRAGQRNGVAQQHAVLALVASVERDAAAVAGHAAAALAIAGPHGLAQAATLAEWASARADLCHGRAAEAMARLGPLVRPGPRRGHFGVRMLAVPCYVEAAALAGRADEAHGAVEEFAVWSAAGIDPQAPALLARCRALLAGPEAAEALYAAALTRHESWPAAPAPGGDFEPARTLLLYGKWLRRRRRPRQARERLRDALVLFERCGARAWADETRAELRATGGPPCGGPPPDGEPAGALARLTPQQLRVARLVAEGATNREVGRSLSVSPRTVDHHLRNVFAALGVRSRVELSRLVDRAGGPPVPAGPQAEWDASPDAP